MLIELPVDKVVRLHSLFSSPHLNQTPLRRRNHKSHSLLFHSRELDFLSPRQAYRRELLNEPHHGICGFGEREIL